MHSSRRTWRIRGVPRDFDKDRLANALRHHSNLRWPGEGPRKMIDNGGSDVNIHTLAPDLRIDEQVATVRFHNLPLQLCALGARSQLTIEINENPDNRPVGDDREWGFTRTIGLLIDEHFDGITTLVSPTTDEEHHIDVLAVSGLGSHPYGSFVHKDDGNMWLTNNLSRDIPTARVMIFGYESGLQHSTSLVQLDDLASPLQIALSQLLRSENRKPLLLIGHSLGGLLVKQALVRLAESGFESDLPNLLDAILGILLFGTPNDGLDIESLVPIVNDQPNRSLLESLSAMNSQVLRQQRQEFSVVLNRTKFQLFCFYETEQSPTAAKVDMDTLEREKCLLTLLQDPTSGLYKMNGPPRFLVNQPSATSCLPASISSAHSIALRRTHSDLVKFSSHDAEYDRVAYILKRLQQMSTSRRISGSECQLSQVRWDLQNGHLATGQTTRLMGETQLNKPAKRPVDEDLPSRKRPRTASDLPAKEHPQTGGDLALHDSSLQDGTEHLKQSLIEQLYFSKIDERLTHLTPAQGTTCRWFLTEPKYKSWQDVAKQPDHGGFLWIKGNPGTGKSTLMKHLFEMAKLNAKGDPSRITLSFFFLARGTVEEKTTTGLYRSLLHQLFEKASDFQDSLEWMTTDGARTVQRNGWSEDALQQTLKHAIPKLGTRSLTIFVDALDECDENGAADMVSFFEELCDCAAEAKVRVQICFSSRYYPAVDVEKGIEVSLEDESGHTEDIQKYIKSKLRLPKSKQAEPLRSEILEKSSGIFLWVVLVLDILSKDQSISIQKKRERLKEIPPKLNDLFQMILTRDGDDLEQLQLCLNWILFATRPLKPQELYFAIQLGADKECSGFWDQADVELDRMKFFVRDSSKGLAEVTRNKASEVQFIHESVRDFLLGKYGGQWSGASGNLKGHGHEVLRDCCLAQLNVSISQKVGISDSLLTSRAVQVRDTIRLSFPFFEYSVFNVLHHSNGAQQNGIHQGQFLADFPLQRWIPLNNALERHDIRRYTESVSLLYLLAEKDLADLIRIHPRRKCCFDVEAERYGAPILAALATGSHEAVRSLLRSQAENEPLTSPLHGLCAQYDQDRTKPTNLGRDLAFSRRRNILTYLLGPGQKAIANAFLLTSPSFNINSRDLSGRTLLTYAAAKGDQAAVKSLLEKGADIELKDDSCRSPLVWAAAQGHEAVVRLLLVNGADIKSTDPIDWTAMLWAAKFGHKAVIGLLLENGADIESTDHEGLTPLSRAAGHGYEDVVGLLLENGADIECKTGSGQTPLSWAAEFGREAVIRLLLEKGADVESTDRAGRTPLSWAECLSARDNQRSESCVRLLQSWK